MAGVIPEVGCYWLALYPRWAAIGRHYTQDGLLSAGVIPEAGCYWLAFYPRWAAIGWCNTCKDASCLCYGNISPDVEVQLQQAADPLPGPVNNFKYVLICVVDNHQEIGIRFMYEYFLTFGRMLGFEPGNPTTES